MIQYCTKSCSLWRGYRVSPIHYGDVIVGAMASQITSLTIVYSTVYSDAGQRKHQSSASLAFVREIHRGPVNSPHKWPVTWKMLPFDDVIMYLAVVASIHLHRLSSTWLPLVNFWIPTDVVIKNVIASNIYIQHNLRNTWSAPTQNGRHFADDILKCILMNEKFCILIKISLKFVP